MHTQYCLFVIVNRRRGNFLGLLEKPILNTMRFFPFTSFRVRMTWSEGPGMTLLFCHCEVDFVSRSNLMEGQEIATPRQVGARNDRRENNNDIRGYSLVR